MITAEILNLAAIIVFLGCIFIYGLKLKIGMKKPSAAKRGLLNTFYRQWVKTMSSRRNPIVAVQSMRNLIMSVTFLSSSILVILGLLVRFNTSGIVELPAATSFSLMDVGKYKMVVLSSTLFFSLMMFLLCLRHMVRFTILIGIPYRDIEQKGAEKIEASKQGKCDIDARDVQCDVFLKAMNRFTYGIRGVYYAVAVLIWFFDTTAFMVATIAVTLLLIKYHDVKPPSTEDTPI
ncbi:MAG: DUF599 domain-containing protein [Candidatus Thermoplasmatota archaeon]